MVDDYRQERERQETEWANGRGGTSGLGWRDEDSYRELITFRQWLEARPIEPEPEVVTASPGEPDYGPWVATADWERCRA